MKSIFHGVVPFPDLKIDAARLERVMGYAPGQSPPPVARAIAAVLQDADARARPCGGFVIFEPDQVNVDSQSVQCGGVRFHTGLLIARQLKPATALAVFVTTAGPGIETWSRQMMTEGELLKGYVADTLGSETAEKAADWLMGEIGSAAAERDWGTTNRFSPGYCGWPVAEQQQLFSLLPSRFCDITLTPSSLMVPLKSVSGIVGLGSTARVREYPCAICGKKECRQRAAASVSPASPGKGNP